LLQFERQAWERGITRLAGVDEAGRGPLAGPVVAAAVILDRTFLETEQHGLLRDIDDSKTLSESQRETAFAFLTERAPLAFAVGMADVAEIDQLNILRATHLAMARALSGLSPLPELALVDGLPVKGLPCPSQAIVDGDARSLIIAAASIVAKVTRDRLMQALDREYPVYGFARHKGYGTQAHMQALLEHGPCPAHRRSFRPVQDALRIREGGRPGSASS
jgi:ribonuclease HII